MKFIVTPLLRLDVLTTDGNISSCHSGLEVIRVVTRLSSRGLWRKTCSGGNDRVRTGNGIIFQWNAMQPGGANKPSVPER
jgi:hypothetical protein